MEKLILLDSNSLINRAFYAMPNLTNRKGEFTGAIFGYVNMLLRLISDYVPTHIIATFDRRAPTFRKEIYSDYKGTRKGMPDELAVQLAPTKRVLEAMNIPIVEMDGFEADDLIGTLSKRFKMQTYIVTGDKDSLQLIDDTTTVLLTKKGVTEIVEYTTARLKEDGLSPSQIIDLKSLMGDASDNIPGVPSVGEKTAMSLLASYATLDGVYEHIGEIKGKLQEKLIVSKDLAYLSYRLATIKTDVPFDFDINSAQLKYPYDIKLKEVFQELEFAKLAEKLNYVGTSEVKENAVKEVEVVEIASEDDLAALILKIKESGSMAIDYADKVHISLTKNDCYSIQTSDNLFGEGVTSEAMWNALGEVIASEKIKKIVYDAKSFMYFLAEFSLILNNYDDIDIKGYLVDANRNYKSLSEISAAYQLPECNKSASLFELNDILDDKMIELGLEKLYYDLELPLVNVLYCMEGEGFAIDKEVLNKQNSAISAEIDILTDEIIKYAGKTFNINSPKQLAQVLFEELGLKSGKKTKTGLSTNVDVLLSLQDAHPIVPLVLRQRELSKLKSTYLDGMLPLIDRNGRIHTVFKQTVTATGRLSSTEPNLQNIPIRKEEGKHIREMFVASKGNRLVCADYSQIELRLTAAFSGDKAMIDAFNHNVDIHTQTAAQVLGIPIDKVTANQRRQAKAVNFGIIYGISDYGLSTDLGIAVWQAREFIQKYFATYPRVKEYLDGLIEIAKEKGYAETYLGRKRLIPELKSSNFNTRGFGERVAMNMPLQGSASDVIKIAMLKVFNKIKDEKLSAKLIMQVHDELIIECPIAEIAAVKELLKECMESVVEFSVKLAVEVSEGANWLEAK